MNKIICLAIAGLFAFVQMPAAYAKEYVVRTVSKPDGTYAFEPSTLMIKSGDTVKWENAQDDSHDIMAERLPKGAEYFASPMLEKKGDHWEYTFKTSGTYLYHCHPHAANKMRGSIIVDQPSMSEPVKGTGHHAAAPDHHNSAAADKQSPLTEQQAVQLLQEGKPVYSCPMHLHVFAGDKDSKCPICGMNLTQVKSIQDGKAVFDTGSQSTPMMNMMEKK
jgi:plastocyanin